MTAKRVASPDTAESRFVVTFSGSCAFVPNKGWKQVRVLFPNNVEGYETEDGTIVPPHRAFLKFQMSDLDDSNRRPPDFVYLEKKEKDKEKEKEKATPIGICILQEEVISLPPSSDSFGHDDTKVTDPKKPKKGELGSVFWIADIGAFCDVAMLETKYLDTRGSTRLAAIVDVRTGFMETQAVSEEVFTVVPKPDAGRVYEQLLAEEVRVSSTAVGPYRIASSKNADLVLKANTGNTHLEIANEVLDDIILPEFRRKKRRTDHDFDLIYDLTQLDRKGPNHRHLPTVIRRIGEAKGTAGCKTARFPEANF